VPSAAYRGGALHVGQFVLVSIGKKIKSYQIAGKFKLHSCGFISVHDFYGISAGPYGLLVNLKEKIRIFQMFPRFPNGFWDEQIIGYSFGPENFHYVGYFRPRILII